MVECGPGNHATSEEEARSTDGCHQPDFLEFAASSSAVYWEPLEHEKESTSVQEECYRGKETDQCKENSRILSPCNHSGCIARVRVYPQAGLDTVDESIYTNERLFQRICGFTQSLVVNLCPKQDQQRVG